MGLFDRAKVAEPPSALGDSFVLAGTVAELKKQRNELETRLKEKDTSAADKAICKTRLEYVNDRMLESRGNKAFEPTIVQNETAKTRKQKLLHPWEWPGPIAPAGMKAVKQPDGTYTHVTTTEEEFQTEEATAEDYNSVVEWAERYPSISGPIVAAHWGTVTARTGGLLYTKTNLMLLQERIKAICSRNEKLKPKEEEPDMGLFDRKVEEPPAKEEIPVEAVAIALQQRKQDARHRLQEAGIETKVETREQADRLLQHRSLAILELGLVYEQFEKAKQSLENFINDISLACDESLEQFFIKNNPTGKKTWSLQYGDLKVANKAEQVALDTSRDMDESLFQAWCKQTLENDPALAQRLKIGPLVSFSRDMREFAAWYKEQPKRPVVPGIRHEPARENVFSIAPSLNTAKDRINDSLKEKGLR